MVTVHKLSNLNKIKGFILVIANCKQIKNNYKKIEKFLLNKIIYQF